MVIQGVELRVSLVFATYHLNHSASPIISFFMAE
jgi:hypothetical protein